MTSAPLIARTEGNEISFKAQDSLLTRRCSIPDDDPNRPRVVVPQQPQAPARRARTVVDYHIDRVSRVQKVIDDYDASLAGSKPGRNVGSSVGRSRRR